MAGVLEYLTFELLELGSHKAQEDGGKKTIMPRHLMLAIKSDSEFNRFFKQAEFHETGRLPQIIVSKKDNKKKKGADEEEEDDEDFAGQQDSDDECVDADKVTSSRNCAEINMQDWWGAVNWKIEEEGWLMDVGQMSWRVIKEWVIQIMRE